MSLGKLNPFSPKTPRGDALKRTYGDRNSLSPPDILKPPSKRSSTSSTRDEHHDVDVFAPHADSVGDDARITAVPASLASKPTITLGPPTLGLPAAHRHVSDVNTEHSTPVPVAREPQLPRAPRKASQHTGTHHRSSSAPSEIPTDMSSSPLQRASWQAKETVSGITPTRPIVPMPLPPAPVKVAHDQRPPSPTTPMPPPATTQTIPEKSSPLDTIKKSMTLPRSLKEVFKAFSEAGPSSSSSADAAEDQKLFESLLTGSLEFPARRGEHLLYQRDRAQRCLSRLAPYLPNDLSTNEIPNVSLPLPVAEFDRDASLAGRPVSVTVVDITSPDPAMWSFDPANVVIVVRCPEDGKSFEYDISRVHPRSVKKFKVFCAFLRMCKVEHGLPPLPTVSASSHQLLCLRLRLLEERIAALEMRA